MPETIKNLFTDIPWPFFLTAIQSGGRVKVNSTRIIESLIIAIVVVLAGYVFLVPEIQANQKTMAAELVKLSAVVERLRTTVQDTQVELGDRWTGTDQRLYIEKHNTQHTNAGRAHRTDYHKGKTND